MRAARWPLLGVVAAILVLVGGSWYQAVVTPAYFSVDEPGHVGYVLAVQDGDLLPEIDDEIPLDGGGPELEARLAATSESRRHMYVAKSPPWPYVLAAGPAALSRAVGLPGGALFGLRVTNLLGGAVAVAATYALGRELSGGDTRVGLVAAGTLAALPYVGFDVALGMIDGIALAATTVTLAILARLCRQGPERATVIALGLAAAAGAGIRAMSLVECAVACAIALGVVLWRRTVPVVWAALWLAVPAALDLRLVLRAEPRALRRRDGHRLPRVHPRPPAGRLARWTSSPTAGCGGRWCASSCCGAATPRCGSSPSGGSPCSASCWPSGWWAPWCSSARASRGPGAPGRIRPPRRRIGSRRPPSGGRPWPCSSSSTSGWWPSTCRTADRPRIRYLMPSVPIVVVMVGQVAVRATRWAGIALIVLVATVQALQLHPLEDSFAARLPPGMDPGPIGPGWVSGAGLVLAVVAGLALVAVLASGRADGAADDDASVALRPPSGTCDRRPPLVRDRWRGIPRSVRAVTALFGALLLAYSLLTPLGEAPDEAAHADLVLHLATGAPYPNYDGRNLGKAVQFGTSAYRPMPGTAGAHARGRARPRRAP